MIKKWIFAAGAGIGYVLGTRAGREQYEKMATRARHLLDHPKMKEATDEAARLYEEGRYAVLDKMRELNHRRESELQHASVGSTTAAPTVAATAPPSAPSPARSPRPSPPPARQTNATRADLPTTN